MKFSGTDVMAVGVIAMGGVVGLACSIAINDGNSSTNTFTVSTDFVAVEEVVAGERVERIRTDASGVWVDRRRDRHDRHESDRHEEREIEFEREAGVTGATVIRIRGDADASAPEVNVRLRESNRVFIQANEEAPEPLIYIDGERFEGDFDALNPDDIERIEVVKGAAAIELFGDDATGGVIQIFLKNAPAPNPGR